MVVNTESEVGVQSSVDKAETSTASRSDRGLKLGAAAICEGIGAVDQSILGSWRSAGLRLLEESIGCLMVPIREQQSALVFIIRSRCWTVDDNAAKYTVPVWYQCRSTLGCRNFTHQACRLK